MNRHVIGLDFNSGNQITSTGYAHDAAGNLTTDPTAGTVTSPITSERSTSAAR